MTITVAWCPEMGVYKVSNGQTERIILPEDFAPNGPLAELAEVFCEARKAVEEARAVSGIHVEV